MITPDGPPSSVVALIEAWRAAGSCPQRPIPWPRQSWINGLPEHAGLFRRLPDELSRDVVRVNARAAGTSPALAVESFLVAMAWGYGMVGYGCWRTAHVLQQNPSAAAELQCTARIVARDGTIAGYRHLANEGRLKFLGPAFGTKYLHFIPQAATGQSALIHDAVVSASIRAHGGPSFSARWSTRNYKEYLDLLTRWSQHLQVDAVDLETSLFTARARGQWADTDTWGRSATAGTCSTATS